MAGDRTDGPQGETALDHRCQPYEARWLFRPLFGSFVLALVLIAVSHLAAFVVWALGSIATIAIARWHEARYHELKLQAALPSAVTISRRRER
ncbi:MAG TPA: hypothetical protein VHW23_33210 [Kofleriaceae bacterium]|jgi:hypothetical protein|nr:hypothetical protein [Kofleriaceae bacterium]